MDIKERMNKVYLQEICFLRNVACEILRNIRELKTFSGMFQNVTKIDITKVAEFPHLAEILDENRWAIEETFKSLNKELDNFKKESSAYKAYFLCIVKESENEYLNRMTTNLKIIHQYLNMHDFYKKVYKYENKIVNSGDNFKFLKNIEKVNKEMIAQMKRVFIGEVSFYDSSTNIIAAYLDDEFYKMASIDRLNSEMNEIKSFRFQNEDPEEKLYKKANANNEKVDSELSTLGEIDICRDKIIKIWEQKEAFNESEKLPFKPFDVERIVSMANRRLEQMLAEIDSVKEIIAVALEYAGADIRDVLRDEQPYIVRDYVEILKIKSSKYDKLYKELDLQSSESLLILYNKVKDIYAMIEEMKCNAYVVDSVRFAK